MPRNSRLLEKAHLHLTSLVYYGRNYMTMKRLSVIAMVAGGAIATGQAQRDLRPAEQVFKNIQSLKGIPANEFMATMGFFSASTGESCTYCHVEESGGNWERYADDNEHKKTARRMIAMVSTINKNYFQGRRMLTCYSCHRGAARPETSPDIALLYGSPRFPEPNSFIDLPANQVPADQVLEKYIQALGGAEKLAAIASFSAKGTYQGYAAPKYPMELFAKELAPGAQRALIVHGDGDTTTVFDGREGWISGQPSDMPVTQLELTGGALDGARLDAVLNFPARLKQALTQWKAGSPASIDDKDMRLVQASMDGRYPTNFYFDNQSGLLARVVRYADSPVGLSPTQIDYSDYRVVSGGVKMPFKWTVSWLDGRSTIVLSEVQTNAKIDDRKFARPAPR